MNNWNSRNNTIENAVKTVEKRNVLELTKEIEHNSIFKNSKSDSRCERYTHITTKNIIDFLGSLGWTPVSANQTKTRKETRNGYQKHLIKFENDLYMLNGERINLLLINSHDGSCSFQLKLGVFRFACSNGLVVGDTFETIRLLHNNLTYDDIYKSVEKLCSSIPVLMNNIEDMKKCLVTPGTMLELAQKAMGLRFEDRLEDITFSELELIQPLRVEDAPKTGQPQTLWKAFNIIQEKIINGNIEYINSQGKKRKLRKINAIDKNIELNSKMFDMALNCLN